MADKFWAVTKIKHGVRTEDGSQEGKYESKTFNVGDEVTGLSKEDMKSLWGAGALTRENPNKEEAPAAEESENGKPPAEPKTPKTPAK